METRAVMFKDTLTGHDQEQAPVWCFSTLSSHTMLGLVYMGKFYQLYQYNYTGQLNHYSHTSINPYVVGATTRPCPHRGPATAPPLPPEAPPLAKLEAKACRGGGPESSPKPVPVPWVPRPGQVECSRLPTAACVARTLTCFSFRPGLGAGMPTRLVKT